MKHVPRGVAAHGMEAALHVNKASGHTLADVVRGVPPETHSSEGGGVWAEYLPKAALMSNDLFLDDVNVLVPVWLGGRGDRPAFAMDATGFFGRYLFTVFSIAQKREALRRPRCTQPCTSPCPPTAIDPQPVQAQ